MNEKFYVMIFNRICIGIRNVLLFVRFNIVFVIDKEENKYERRICKCYNLYYIIFYFKRIIFILIGRIYIFKEGIKFKCVKMDYIIK